MCTATDTGEERPGKRDGCGSGTTEFNVLPRGSSFLPCITSQQSGNNPATIDQMRENNRTSGIAVQVPEGLHGNPAASEPGGHRSSDGQGRQSAPAHTRCPYQICVISGAHWPQVLVQFFKF